MVTVDRLSTVKLDECMRVYACVYISAGGPVTGEVRHHLPEPHRCPARPLWCLQGTAQEIEKLAKLRHVLALLSRVSGTGHLLQVT